MDRIFSLQIRDEQRLTEWSEPIVLRPQASEYELSGLKANTHYLIAVRVFNLAGVTERRIRKMTTKFCSSALLCCESCLSVSEE